nr:IclR family transcriptional regulator [uncultured bacterium]
MLQERVKSAARIIEILEFFSRRRRPARMYEISEALGYPGSSLTALLRTIVAMGYMEFDEETHLYFPAARLANLTNWIETGGYEQTIVLDALHRIRDDLEEPVVLAAQEGLHVQYFISLHCHDGTHSHIRPGTRRLMIRNGIGLQMLSRMPRDQALDVYQLTIDSGLFDSADFSEAEFLGTLDDYMTTDVVIVDAKNLPRQTAHWNASMISILIPVPQGHRSLGVGVHGPTARMTERAPEINARLRELTRDLRT